MERVYRFASHSRCELLQLIVPAPPKGGNGIEIELWKGKTTESYQNPGGGGGIEIRDENGSLF
jgi:hypothetical protein